MMFSTNNLKIIHINNTTCLSIKQVNKHSFYLSTSYHHSYPHNHHLTPFGKHISYFIQSVLEGPCIFGNHSSPKTRGSMRA